MAERATAASVSAWGASVCQCQLTTTGFSGGDSTRRDSMCAIRFETGQFVHVPDASVDPPYQHNPWVTGAETCELVLALDALGESERAHQQLAAMQHLRDPDGSYWTGYVFTNEKRWPVERSTWTAAAVVLAADALSRTTPGNGVFRGEDLPAIHALDAAPCC